MRRTAGIIASVSLLVLALAAPAAAKRIVVNTTADEFNTGAGCSLREAIQSAQTNTDFGGCVRAGSGRRDPVIVETGEGYPFVLTGADDDVNATGDLDITGKVTIKAEGASSDRARIDANDLDRVIDIRPGGSLTASKLIIEDGQVPGALSDNSGAGIRVTAGAALDLSGSELLGNEILSNSGNNLNGGGIGTQGSVTLDRVRLTDNHTTSVGGGIAQLGGKLVVSRSVLTLNTVSGSGGAGLYLGGNGGSVARINRTTITGNHALHTTLSGGGGIFASALVDPNDFRLTNVTISGNLSNHDGGGIYAIGNGTILSVNATTITGNTADYEETESGNGGGIAGFGAAYRNSIIADNYNPLVIGNEQDCAPFTPIGGTHNLVGDDTGCSEQGNVVTADPLLKPLGDYGGPTETHALRKGSPAIGKAGRNSSPSRDQRGVRRDERPDIGAFER